MDKFSAPTPVSDVLMTFPGDVKHLMPRMVDIPDEFKRNHPWAQWQSNWFYSGLSKMPTPKDGIQLQDAMRHLSAIQGSFQPSHEHKRAAVAYLASLWFTGEGT